MIGSISKVVVILFPTLSYCIISCGTTLPLQEISTAKQEITRARVFSSEKYAKIEFDDSRTNLLLAHENAFSSKPDFKKVVQLSQASTAKATEAIKKSLPNYVKDIQKEVEVALQSANEALAETLASDIYEQAALLKIEGDEIVKNADSKLATLSNEDNVEKAIIYDDYEKGIKRYRESVTASEKARDLSLAQTQAIIDSSSDIESSLDLIEKYSKENVITKAKIGAMREEYKSSIDLMEKGKLRDGFKKLEEIRKNSNELMASVILPYAKERIKVATLKIEDADKFLNSGSENAKSSSASDSLTASKEAFSSSVDLLAKERYYDSIQQSDEAIRLAEDILKSQDESDSEFSNKKRSDQSIEEESSEQVKTEKPTKKEKTPITVKPATSSSSNIKWKKHIVTKKNPPETLWRIASDKKYLGNKDLWKEIYKANQNKISNPNLIYPNQVILIPTKDAKSVSKKQSKSIK